MAADLAEKHGSTLYRSAVGEANVVELMLEQRQVGSAQLCDEALRDLVCCPVQRGIQLLKGRRRPQHEAIDVADCRAVDRRIAGNSVPALSARSVRSRVTAQRSARAAFCFRSSRSRSLLGRSKEPPEILEAQRMIVLLEGVFCEPASAAGFATGQTISVNGGRFMA